MSIPCRSVNIPSSTYAFDMPNGNGTLRDWLIGREEGGS